MNKLSEAQFRELILRFARKAGVDVEHTGKGRMVVRSSDKAASYEEVAPPYAAMNWAVWWAGRLLHPERQIDVDEAIQGLFDSYKKGGRSWNTYNDDKRALLARYLKKPYAPPKRRRKK